MKSLFSTEGRISRRRYLILFLVFYFTNLLALLKMYEAVQFQLTVSFIAYGIVLIVTIAVLLIQSAKRLHDLGYQGKLALWLLIPPPINFIGFLWLCAKPGQNGDNKFGPQPNPSNILN
jgi:uncharacterized membrane protein YhaH (DUF805 family)